MLTLVFLARLPFCGVYLIRAILSCSEEELMNAAKVVCYYVFRRNSFPPGAPSTDHDR